MAIANKKKSLDAGLKWSCLHAHKWILTIHTTGIGGAPVSSKWGVGVPLLYPIGCSAMKENMLCLALVSGLHSEEHNRDPLVSVVG